MTGRKPIEERFWEKVDTSGECWEWQGGYSGKPKYPQMRIEGKLCKAHRVAYTLANGPIPDGLLVRHTCDNRKCVKPDHLIVGTTADNVADRVARGRSACGATHGSAKLTPALVAEIRASDETERSLAERMGVHPSAIGNARRGKTWRVLVEHCAAISEPDDDA